METIKNYLETMFMNLPNTEEVRRAKDELGQMMEDKFAELIEEGKTENEAVGTVISEFGNLNEVAEALGINSYVNGTQERDNTVNQMPARMITMGEAKQYIHDKSNSAFMVAFGVLLCIISVTGPIITDAIANSIPALGVLFMLISIGVAIALFVFSGIRMSKWDFIKKTRCAVDFATYNEVKNEKERYRNTHALLVTIGVLLCCICFVPAAIMDEMNIFVTGIDMDDFAGATFFGLIGIGVFLMVLGSVKNEAYKTLLAVNDATTMGGNYKTESKVKKYSNPKVEAVMSVYWSTVTCIYLIWSFVTFDWFITWIVWPVAAIVNVLIDNIFGED